MRVSWFSAWGCCEAKASLCWKALRADHHQPPSPPRSPAQGGRAVPRLPAGPCWLVPQRSFPTIHLLSNGDQLEAYEVRVPEHSFRRPNLTGLWVCNDNLTSTSSHCRPASQSQHSRTFLPQHQLHKPQCKYDIFPAYTTDQSQMLLKDKARSSLERTHGTGWLLEGHQESSCGG